MLTNNKATWLDDHVAKQRTKVHVEVNSFHDFDLSMWALGYIDSTRARMHILSVWLHNGKT